MNAFNRCIARVLIVCTISFGLPPSSIAGIVTTDEVRAGVNRDEIRNFLDRADVMARMQELGVDPAAARARVEALSDHEIALLADQMDQLPAGGADALVVVAIVFIVLLITDILGYTKIFPFTKPAQK